MAEQFRQRTDNCSRLDRSEPVNPKGASGQPWRNALGVTVCVYTREDAGVDGDEPWVASCETHGQMVCCPTKALAKDSARMSAEFCSECREITKRK